MSSSRSLIFFWSSRRIRRSSTLVDAGTTIIDLHQKCPWSVANSAEAPARSSAARAHTASHRIVAPAVVTSTALARPAIQCHAMTARDALEQATAAPLGERLRRLTGLATVAPCGSRCVSVVATAFIAACVGACGSPSAPTPPPTRVLSLSGNLTFASVLVGATATATLTISNNGTGTVTVSSIGLPSGGFSASWTNGQIGAGQTQSVLITFAPTAAGTFSGALSVNSDQTAGSSVLGISGTATLPIAIYDAGSNGVSIPTLVREVKPSYTADAIANRIQGTVL